MKRAFPEKPLHWVGSAKDDLLEFPDEVIDDFGYALYLAARIDQRRIHDRLKAAMEDYEVRYGREKA